MADTLKVLTEASMDNLFVLTGLALLVLAVLGSVSGKFELGKGGRIAAGLIGAVLIFSGLWMHANHGLKINYLAVSTPQNHYQGPCPVDINLQGIIDAVGTGTVVYAFEYSDGAGSLAASLDFDKSAPKLVNAIWRVHNPLADGWVRLKTLAPQQMESKDPVQISVTCQASSGGPGIGSKQPTEPETASQKEPGKPALPPGGAPEPDPQSDYVQFLSISPRPGTFLKRGQPFEFKIALSYNLVSADSAILAISVAQLASSVPGCLGPGHLPDAAEFPAVRGTHELHVIVTWSGDTGVASKGRIDWKGFLSFTPSLWASDNGRRAKFLKGFGVFSQYCYPFGP